MKTSESEPALSLERAKDILDAYGATPDRWPEAEREAMLMLLTQSTDLRAQRETATSLDSLLDLWDAQPQLHPFSLPESLPPQASPERQWWLSFTDDLLSPLVGWQRLAFAATPIMIGFFWGLQGANSAEDWSATEFSLLNPIPEVTSNE
tara:strand:- start:562 stop:1011 length:450 start_codon:yes stop_codon:yes gene_type:complete